MAETAKEIIARLETLLSVALRRLHRLESEIGRNVHDGEEIEEGSAAGPSVVSRVADPALGPGHCEALIALRRKPGFPASELVNGQWQWWLSAIQKFERKGANVGKCLAGDQ